MAVWMGLLSSKWLDHRETSWEAVSAAVVSLSRSAQLLLFLGQGVWTYSQLCLS